VTPQVHPPSLSDLRLTALGERHVRGDRPYILDGGEEDLQRLVRVSEISADALRAALHRIQIREGSRVIECGCGPIGGLAVLAEAVGQSGRVVGVDFNESAVQRARSTLATLALDNVEVVAGDANDLDLAALGAPSTWPIRAVS
jgi:precorrin-6B methylase 2